MPVWMYMRQALNADITDNTITFGSNSEAEWYSAQISSVSIIMDPNTVASVFHRFVTMF